MTTQAVAQVDELVGHYRRLLGQWHRRVLWMDWTHPAVQEPPGGFCCGWAAFTAVAKGATLQPKQEDHRQSRFHVPLLEKSSNGTFTIPEVSHMSTSSEVGLTLSTIGMLIVAARRSVRQLIAAKVVPLDITPHHYWMLRIISKGAPMSLGELARAMWMDAPTVSRMVQQMGLRGYLTVGPDPTHGRRIRIRLTEEGLVLCEKLVEIGGDFQENSQKGMTAEEVVALHEGLCKFIRNLDVMVASQLPGMPIRPQRHHETSEEQSQKSGT